LKLSSSSSSSLLEGEVEERGPTVTGHQSAQRKKGRKGREEKRRTAVRFRFGSVHDVD